jgi:D5 N terminal like
MKKGQPKPEKQLRGAEFFAVWREAHVMGLVPEPPPEKGNGTGGPILATYPYVDESGALIFEVVRRDATDPDDRFRQRRPDGNGGWIWDTKDVRSRILYRLPQLIAAVKAGQRVLICEGERDVNTAVALGYAATTMPGGINRWRAEYDKYFRGADVAVVSDSDAQARNPKTGAPRFHPNGRPVLPGQDHAEKLVGRLRKVAAHVRSIIFSQKDLSAWREAGGDRAALDALIAAAPDLVKQPAPDDTAPTPSDRELPPFCDEALALRFAARHADELRYVAEWGKWLRWNGKLWRPDRTIRAFDLARAVCREAAAEPPSSPLTSPAQRRSRR